MKRIFVFPIVLVALLGIAGCGTASPAPVEETAPPVEEAPMDPNTIIEPTADQAAYLHCVRNERTITIEYSSEQNGYLLYCERTGEPRCLAANFLEGDCEKEGEETILAPGAIQRTTIGLVSGPRFCDPVATPVCGADGRTYTNACVAAQQHVAVAADGACGVIPDVQLPETQSYRRTRPTNTTRSGGTSQTTAATGSTADGPTETLSGPPTPPPDTATLTTDEGMPDWLNIPISMLQQTETIPKAVIESCRIAGTDYYLQVEGEDEHFSILYDRAGSVVCYPQNDLSGACPAFNMSRRSCTVVWEK